MVLLARECGQLLLFSAFTWNALPWGLWGRSLPAWVGTPEERTDVRTDLRKNNLSFTKDISVKDSVKDTPVDNVLYESVMERGQWSEP